MERTLGIDIGTSGTKVVLLDRDGRLVDEATSNYPMETPEPGWAQQDPAIWWSAVRAALAMLWERGHQARDIVGIGLTGQMHSLVLVDAAGEPLCPSLLWCDQRTAAECDAMRTQVGEAAILEQTGNVALTGFTAPKILWVRDHWPDAYRQARHILLPKDFIRLRLTGAITTDHSDASGTLLFNVRQRDWAHDLIRDLAIDPALLPPSVDGPTITGHVTPEAAALTGLIAGTPVVAGGSDNAAAAVGLGAIDPGVLTLSIGTSGVLFAPLTAYPARIDGRLHIFCHAIPDRWHAMAVTLSAGGSLRWLRDLLGDLLPVQGDAAYAWLAERAATAPPGSDGLTFLPYLTGERTPHGDPNARGVFQGLHLGHRLEHMVRAVLEGVAFSQRQGLDLMRTAGATATTARGAGGGLSSPIWRQILADVLNIGIQTTSTSIGAARGAAILAGMGTNLYTNPDRGIDWSDEPTTSPDPATRTALDRAYRDYVDLYPHLKQAYATHR